MAGNLKKFVNPRFIKTIDLALMKPLLARHEGKYKGFSVDLLDQEEDVAREALEKLKLQFPDAPVVAHPECTQAVRLLADEVCSTEKMVSYCKNAPVKDIIVVTESGMLHRLRKECPKGPVAQA